MICSLIFKYPETSRLTVVGQVDFYTYETRRSNFRHLPDFFKNVYSDFSVHVLTTNMYCLCLVLFRGVYLYWITGGVFLPIQLTQYKSVTLWYTVNFTFLLSM